LGITGNKNSGKPFDLPLLPYKATASVELHLCIALFTPHQKYHH
jgi:hypothetical protein